MKNSLYNLPEGLSEERFQERAPFFKTENTGLNEKAFLEFYNSINLSREELFNSNSRTKADVVLVPHIRRDVLAILANDESYRVRAMISSRTDTSLEFLLKFAKEKSMYVRANVAGNIKSTPDLLMQLYHNKDESNLVKETIAGNPNITSEIIDLLIKNKDQNVRSALAENNNLSSNYLEILSEDEYYIIRMLVARNKNTSSKLLQKLFLDENYLVSRDVLGNPNTPSNILEKASLSTARDGLYNISKNPNSPQKALQNLLRYDCDPHIHDNLLVNPNTPENVVDSLLKYNPKVIALDWYMSSSRQYSNERLRKLYRLRENGEAVIKNPNVPKDIVEEIAERILQEQDFKYKKEFAQHKYAPIDILNKLSIDQDWEVRKAVANNPNFIGKVVPYDDDEKVNDWIISALHQRFTYRSII